MKCRRCGYQFILNPKSMGVGDKRLFKAAEKLSLSGTTYFTRDQLICACFLKKERQSGFRFVAFILLSLISVLFGIFKIWPAALFSW
ncbi:MAG: hypothetical protein LR011_13830 [Verrucomicrobia bacterium]|nr:hypothetical protein [Verrucomicrobiota bacterium]